MGQMDLADREEQAEEEVLETEGSLVQAAE
jgi:hypothetical protein